MTRPDSISPSPATPRTRDIGAQASTPAAKPMGQAALPGSPCGTYSANAPPGAKQPLVVPRKPDPRKFVADRNSDPKTDKEAAEEGLLPPGGSVWIPGVNSQSGHSDQQSGQGDRNRPFQLNTAKSSSAAKPRGAARSGHDSPGHTELSEDEFLPAGGLDLDSGKGQSGQSDQSGQQSGQRGANQSASLEVVGSSGIARPKGPAGRGLDSFNHMTALFRRRCNKTPTSARDQVDLVDSAVALFLAAGEVRPEHGYSPAALTDQTLKFVNSELARQGLTLPQDPVALAAAMAAESRAQSADGRPRTRSDVRLLRFLQLLNAGRASPAMPAQSPFVNPDQYRHLFAASPS